VSYPDRFVVTPEGAAEADRMAARGGYYDPGYRRGYRSYLWGPYYRPLGLGYYGYSPFGYYGYGWGGYYGGYYGYRPATVIVQPASPESRGRMVPGRGYTRGSSSGVGSGDATPRSSVGGPAPSSSRSGGGSVRRSGGSSDGSGASSGSRGSSGSSTGRRAQPRGN